MIKRIKRDTGFTLLELMIVVAIVGVLVATAIPSFMQYIKNSKTSEARESLASISKGAFSYFQEEHCYDDVCLSPFTRLYPGIPTNVGTESGKWENTKGIRTVPLKVSTVIGLKTDPATVRDVLLTHPWTDLRFWIDQPFYYNYYYESSGIQPEASAFGFTSFGAAAEASLSKLYDSTFLIRGTPAGNIGNIIEITDETAGTTRVPKGLAFWDE